MSVLLRWLEACCWLLSVWLGMWVVLLHTYLWLGDTIWQRQEIVNYLLGNGMQVLPEMNFLNLAEQRHLLDVRRLFAATHTLFYVLLAGSLLLAGVRRYWWQGHPWLRTGYLGIASILLPGGVMLLGGFVPLFIVLHTLVFPPNTWVFPDDSILIRLFPLDYFFWFGLLYVVSLLVVFLGMVVWGHTRQR